VPGEMKEHAGQCASVTQDVPAADTGK
jgi:hypothetical protein